MRPAGIGAAILAATLHFSVVATQKPTRTVTLGVDGYQAATTLEDFWNQADVVVDGIVQAVRIADVPLKPAPRMNPFTDYDLRITTLFNRGIQWCRWRSSVSTTCACSSAATLHSPVGSSGRCGAFSRPIAIAADL